MAEAKRGRPLTEINWVEFDKLCHIQCSLREIASWFDCSIDTIERAVERDKGMLFAEYFEQKRGRGKIALRRKMFEAAMAGDKTLMIWLSKQYLGMSEKQEIKQETQSNEKLVINFKEAVNDLKSNGNNI
jgi:hypothetical protein